MKKQKCVMWFLVWAILLIVCTIYSATKEILLFLNHGIALTASTFADYQKDILFFWVPTCLIPPLGISLIYAVKERNRVLKIITSCFLMQHIACIVVFALIL